ncbi:hypothetical protein INT45_001150 [Circinella minor]|uniref:Uncharacterized protein n=1 Tax=Circinella minor TaxID=1195481 RepID=A0A8H7VKG9_9FUNG|nr:hypothetical protein INT45_001150 [Circinella minor]
MDYQHTWNTDQPAWESILEDVLKKTIAKQQSLLPASSPPAPTTKKASSSNGSKATLLGYEQRLAVYNKQQQMLDKKKWKLKDGTTVEDRLYNYGQNIQHEYAFHSMIMNLSDKRLKQVFSEKELKDVENHNLLPLPLLSDSVTTFFEKFKGKEAIDDIWEIADWAKRSILDVVSAYRWDTVAATASRGAERDLIMLLWRSIDTSFQNIHVQTWRSDEQTCSGSARVNEDRLGSDGSIKAKISAVKPDLILTKDNLEYGSAEHGFDDESGVGEKELHETYTKLPKTMKNMMMKLMAEVDYDEKAIRSLRVVGLVHSHLRMTAYLMDVPDGYVCRIRKLGEQRIPDTLTDFYDTYRGSPLISHPLIFTPH